MWPLSLGSLSDPEGKALCLFHYHFLHPSKAPILTNETKRNSNLGHFLFLIFVWFYFLVQTWFMIVNRLSIIYKSIRHNALKNLCQVIATVNIWQDNFWSFWGIILDTLYCSIILLTLYKVEISSSWYRNSHFIFPSYLYRITLNRYPRVYLVNCPLIDT